MDTIDLYHGGITFDRIEDDHSASPFAGVFAHVNIDVARSHGPDLYRITLAKNDVLSDYTLNYNIDIESITVALASIVDDAIAAAGVDDFECDRLFDCAWTAIVCDQPERVDDNDLQSLFPAAVDGIADRVWHAQGARGRLAKILGYSAVEISDEHGTSYLVNSNANDKLEFIG